MRQTRVHRAVEIREATLTVLHSVGKWDRNFRDGDKWVPHRVASIGRISMSLRTPFTPEPGPSDGLIVLAARQGLRIPTALSYGLDIWAPKKVMNIEWSDRGELVIVSFRRGAWEDELISAADAMHRQFA